MTSEIPTFDPNQDMDPPSDDREVKEIEAAGTMSDAYERSGSRPADAGEIVEEFEQEYGPSLPPDGEG